MKFNPKEAMYRQLSWFGLLTLLGLVVANTPGCTPPAHAYTACPNFDCTQSNNGQGLQSNTNYNNQTYQHNGTIHNTVQNQNTPYEPFPIIKIHEHGITPCCMKGYQITDHYKNVIQKKPIIKKLCTKGKNQLLGAIIGGALGKEATDGKDAGALMGALIGNEIAKNQENCQNEVVGHTQEMYRQYSHSSIHFWYQNNWYKIDFQREDRQMDVLAIWNELTYGDGILFSLWIGVMYFAKCWIDQRFRD